MVAFTLTGAELNQLARSSSEARDSW
jgi:hypothetical protein